MNNFWDSRAVSELVPEVVCHLVVLLVLNVCLKIIFTRKGMEKLWLLPAKKGEPVLLCQGALKAVLLHHLHHPPLPKVFVVLLARPHPSQVVQHHPSVESLQEQRNINISLCSSAR